MTLVITHNFTSTTTESTSSGTGGGLGIVGPSEWNANHTLTGLATPVQGGTGISSGLGVPYFSATQTISDSGTLTQNAVVLGGGANGAPTVVGTVGTTSQVLFGGPGGGAPQWGTAPGGGSVTPPATFTLSSSTSTATLLALVTSTTTGASQYAQQLSITGTWNDSAHTFDAPLFMNITNTNSAAASLLVDWQVGGATAWSFSIPNAGSGAVTLNTGSNDLQIITHGNSPDNWDFANGVFTHTGGGTENWRIGNSGQFIAKAGGFYEWTSGFSNGTPDTSLWRDGAVIVAVGNSQSGGTASALRVYNTTDNAGGAPTNYERGIFDWTTSANILMIGTQTGGTGSARHFQVTRQTTNGTNNIYFTSATFTTTSMPAAGNAGARIVITDGSSSATFLSTPAGGGSFTAPLYDDGTKWRYG